MKTDYKTWPLDELAVYIEHNFHCYIRTSVPQIREKLHALCQTDVAVCPALTEIEHIFITASDELERHLCREERDLFPIIQVLTAADGPTSQVSTKEIVDPIHIMLREHNAEIHFFRQIKKLTDNYVPPAGSCEELGLLFKQLQEFDRKLQRHIELENNVLFPTAIELAEHIAVR